MPHPVTRSAHCRLASDGSQRSGSEKSMAAETRIIHTGVLDKHPSRNEHFRWPNGVIGNTIDSGSIIPGSSPGWAIVKGNSSFSQKSKDGDKARDLPGFSRFWGIRGFVIRGQVETLRTIAVG